MKAHDIERADAISRGRSLTDGLHEPAFACSSGELASCEVKWEICEANIRHIVDPMDPAAVSKPEFQTGEHTRKHRELVLMPLCSRSPVHGVVHAISQKDLAALDSSEQPLYHRVEMLGPEPDNSALNPCLAVLPKRPVQVNTPHGPEEAGQRWANMLSGAKAR